MSRAQAGCKEWSRGASRRRELRLLLYGLHCNGGQRTRGSVYSVHPKCPVSLSTRRRLDTRPECVYLRAMERAQETARKARKGMYRYGDVQDSEEEGPRGGNGARWSQARQPGDTLDWPAADPAMRRSVTLM